MEEYTIVYSKNFQTSLESIIKEWEEVLFLPPDSIKRFIRVIQKALELAKTFPTMYEEVSEIYNMDAPTYRIVIGKSYALFYQINQEQKEIHVGRIFQSKQMRVSF